MKMLTSKVLFLAVAVVAMGGYRKAETGCTAGGPTGYFEGTAKSQQYGDFSVSLNLRCKNGKYEGEFSTPQGSLPVTEGTVDAGQLRLQFDAGNEFGTVVSCFDTEVLRGAYFVPGDDSGSLQLHRAGDARPSPPERVVNLSLTKEQWHEDVSYFAKQLSEKHADAFHRLNREAFQHLVSEVDAAIQKSRSEDIPVEMLKITAAVGDGHTHVVLGQSARVLPAGFFWFGNDLRITKATPSFQRAVGTRVLKIGDVPLDEVKRRLAEICSQGENRWFFLDTSARLLTRPDVLHALKLTDDLNHARFTLEEKNGSSFTLDLVPVDRDKLAWVYPFKQPPPYVEHVDDAFWFTMLPNSRTIYVIFNRYNQLSSRSRALFEYMDQHPTDRLIIDLRNNGGGDFEMGYMHLILPIRERAELNEKGHLFVITGRHTFSAAMSNATHFHTDTHASLVGEPPGEVPNSFQESRRFELPSSHIRIQYSIKYYKFLDQDVSALMPDKEIDPDWTAYEEGRDPVLDWITATYR
jgi:hypothetical protein